MGAIADTERRLEVLEDLSVVGPVVGHAVGDDLLRLLRRQRCVGLCCPDRVILSQRRVAAQTANTRQRGRGAKRGAPFHDTATR